MTITLFQIKEQLKHIGGLCYALAIDIGQTIDHETDLQEQVKTLQATLDQVTQSPEYRKAKQNAANKRRKERQREQQRNPVSPSADEPTRRNLS